MYCLLERNQLQSGKTGRSEPEMVYTCIGGGKRRDNALKRQRTRWKAVCGGKAGKAGRSPLGASPLSSLLTRQDLCQLCSPVGLVFLALCLALNEHLGSNCWRDGEKRKTEDKHCRSRGQG